MRDGISINSGSIKAFMDDIEATDNKLRVALKLVTDTVAKKMENWAKENRPWTDRTTNAKQGLTGEAYWEYADSLVASMSHTVEYGVWLELAMERRFAILDKAIEKHKEEFLEGWEQTIEEAMK